MSLAAAAEPASGSAIVPFVVIALLGVIAVAGILVSRSRRRHTAAADPARPAEPEVLWGLHVPGTPVQRMGRSFAVGFAALDPEETSHVVRSTDGGANWYVVPREKWTSSDE